MGIDASQVDKVALIVAGRRCLGLPQVEAAIRSRQAKSLTLCPESSRGRRPFAFVTRDGVTASLTGTTRFVPVVIDLLFISCICLEDLTLFKYLGKYLAVVPKL